MGKKRSQYMKLSTTSATLTVISVDTEESGDWCVHCVRRVVVEQQRPLDTCPCVCPTWDNTAHISHCTDRWTEEQTHTHRDKNSLPESTAAEVND